MCYSSHSICRAQPVKMNKVVQRKKLILMCVSAVVNMKVKKRQKRKWVKEWLLQRPVYSDIHLVRNLRMSELSDFVNYLRMTNVQFDYLLKMIEPSIKKANTLMRSAISAEQRLVVTLRYLATGSDYKDLQYMSRISAQAIGKIVPETCWAIYNALKETYLKFPSNESEWRCISDGFRDQWDFEHCLGALDGKHVVIEKPPDSGSYYYNYKGTFSVVLFAIVNANYEFIYVHEGTNGRVSDGGILRKTDFYDKLVTRQLQIPAPSKLVHSSCVSPYGFVGDDAFPLMENIWKPYSRADSSKEERIFNYRLSRARRVVENAFGILSSRFKVFQKAMKIKVEHVDAVILASCVLHNFLRMHSTNYITQTCVDSEDFDNGSIVPGNWREEMQLLPLNRSSVGRPTNDIKAIRNSLKDYYYNEGKIAFQNKMCGIPEEN